MDWDLCFNNCNDGAILDFHNFSCLLVSFLPVLSSSIVACPPSLTWFCSEPQQSTHNVCTIYEWLHKNDHFFIIEITHCTVIFGKITTNAETAMLSSFLWWWWVHGCVSVSRTKDERQGRYWVTDEAHRLMLMMMMLVMLVMMVMAVMTIMAKTDEAQSLMVMMIVSREKHKIQKRAKTMMSDVDCRPCANLSSECEKKSTPSPQFTSLKNSLE